MLCRSDWFLFEGKVCIFAVLTSSFLEKKKKF